MSVWDLCEQSRKQNTRDDKLDSQQSAFWVLENELRAQ